jgi:colanic acid/amylovoran biosynthesis glycosyltransferase
VQHLHAHFGTNSAAVALLCRHLGGPPFSFTVHGPEEFDQPRALSLAEKIRGAAFVVGISDFGRSQLFRWCDSSQWQKIHVVHCGLDAAYLDRPSASVNVSQRLVSVGRLCEQKGQILLVAAAGKLREEFPDFELVLVGDGPMRQDVEAAIKHYGLSGKVRITGWLSNEAVQAEIEAGRAFVLASFAEGLPVVLMEALALGRPALSTFVAGIPEIIHDGENGRLVPAGDIDALINAMRWMLNCTAEQLQEMGNKGREIVQERHDVRREAAKLQRLFETYSAG